MPPIHVLNVAEKPSVAKEVARILNQGGQPNSRRECGCVRTAVAANAPVLFGRPLPLPLPSHAHSSAVYNPIWDFGCTIAGQPGDMHFTSITGAPPLPRKRALPALPGLASSL